MLSSNNCENFAAWVTTVGCNLSSQVRSDALNVVHHCRHVGENVAVFSLEDTVLDPSELPEYRARMLVLGQTVEVILPDGSSRPAAAVDIDPECRLLVRFPGEDSLTPLGSGEVRIRI